MVYVISFISNETRTIKIEDNEIMWIKVMEISALLLRL